MAAWVMRVPGPNISEATYAAGTLTVLALLTATIAFSARST